MPEDKGGDSDEVLHPLYSAYLSLAESLTLLQKLEKGDIDPFDFLNLHCGLQNGQYRSKMAGFTKSYHVNKSGAPNQNLSQTSLPAHLRRVSPKLDQESRLHNPTIASKRRNIEIGKARRSNEKSQSRSHSRKRGAEPSAFPESAQNHQTSKYSANLPPKANSQQKQALKGYDQLETSPRVQANNERIIKMK